MTRDNITWKEANADQRQQLLESGGADLIVSTFSITDQRKQVVDFAGPYFVAHQDLLVRRNDTEITGPEALDGKTLCSVPGTTSAAYVTSHFLGNIKLLEKPRFSDCVNCPGQQRGRRGHHRRRDPGRASPPNPSTKAS